MRNRHSCWCTSPSSNSGKQLFYSWLGKVGLKLSSQIKVQISTEFISMNHVHHVNQYMFMGTRIDMPWNRFTRFNIKKFGKKHISFYKSLEIIFTSKFVSNCSNPCSVLVAISVTAGGGQKNKTFTFIRSTRTWTLSLCNWLYKERTGPFWKHLPKFRIWDIDTIFKATILKYLPSLSIKKESLIFLSSIL